MCSLVQSCLTLCNFMDYSPPDSSVHGNFQTRILEWVPFPPQGIFPTQGLNLRLLHWQAFSLPAEPPGKPYSNVKEKVYLFIFFIEKTLKLRKKGKTNSGCIIRSDRIRSVAQSCLTLCDPMNHSTPGLPVHHQLPEFTQTHVH